MKTPIPTNQRGSAFITVMGFCVILLLLVASVLQYSTFEHRLNNRSKLLYESRVAAESLSEYGVAQVKKKLESNRTFTDNVWSSADQSLFVPGGSYAGTIGMPPDNFWGGGHIVDSTGASTDVPLMHVGKILDVAAGGLYFVDPTNPANANDPLKGKRVFRYDLDILSRATATDSFGGGNVTKYMQQSFSIRAVPLFANAVYYNMDMEVQPGPNFTITGSTHTNGRLFVRSASNNPTYINFAGPVVAVKGIWTNFQNTNLMPFFQSYNDQGILQTNVTTGLVQILPGGAVVFKGMQLTAATTGFATNLPASTWVESTWNLLPGGETWQQHIGDGATTPTATSTTKANFANWTSQTFLGNLLTDVNGLTAINLQGMPDYSYTYGSLYPDPGTGTSEDAYTYIAGGNDINNSAHGLIEAPRVTTSASYLKTVEDIKYSRNAALYIVANTTQAVAVGHQPDGMAIRVGARSYRAFMNDSSTLPATITEVILPGQKSYGDSNTIFDAITNPLRTAHATTTPVVQMLNIDYSVAIPVERANSMANQRRMTDNRRTGVADANLATATTTFDASVARSATNIYIPKNLFMIDIDMSELRKAVATINIATGTTVTTAGTQYYATGLPTAGNIANHIYAASPTLINAILSDTTRIITTTYTAGTPYTTAFTSAIWNGAIYVESIAAASFDTTGVTAAIRKAKTYNNRNSGVRLINGRGKVPSIDSTQGMTLATNDVVYVLGDFNTDGLAATPAVVAVLVPAAPGDSTGHNFETGELPASIAADAVYLLSQPLVNGTPNGQTAGWSDAFSAYAENAGANYNASWATIVPSSTNRRDGLVAGVAFFPYKIPYDSSNGSWTAGTSATYQLPGSFTEYSFAMLCGLVPTGKNGVTQTSGGLHNFPRFLENWGGIECRIRGAMVALFECRVGTEPWNLRVYSPPLRIWGFNLLFNTGVMPPLTPKSVHFRRSSSNDITKTDYNIKLTAWGYPTLP